MVITYRYNENAVTLRLIARCICHINNKAGTYGTYCYYCEHTMWLCIVSGLQRACPNVRPQLTIQFSDPRYECGWGGGFVCLSFNPLRCFTKIFNLTRWHFVTYGQGRTHQGGTRGTCPSGGWEVPQLIVSHANVPLSYLANVPPLAWPPRLKNPASAPDGDIFYSYYDVFLVEIMSFIMVCHKKCQHSERWAHKNTENYKVASFLFQLTLMTNKQKRTFLHGILQSNQFPVSVVRIGDKPICRVLLITTSCGSPVHNIINTVSSSEPDSYVS